MTIITERSQLIAAILNTFALVYENFPLGPETEGQLTKIWTQALAPFAHEVIEQAISQTIEEVGYRPEPKHVIDRCRALTPRPAPTALDYLDELPQRDYMDEARAKAFKAKLYSRPEWVAEIKAAKAEIDALLSELGAARAAQDVEREARAHAAIAEARSPAAYRRWQIERMEAIEPGSSERLTFAAECPTCGNQRYVLVPNQRVLSVPNHWVRVPVEPNAPRNAVGVLFHCPECVTPSIAERRRRAA